MNINASLRPFALCTLLLTGLGQAAHATVLLNEDFNDNAAAYTGVFAAGADANAINIRPESNTINTSGDTGFDAFFGAGTGGNSFLVIGDNADEIGGPPNGPDGAFSMAKFDLGVMGPGLHSLGINFDFAFDTDQDPGVDGTTRNTDLFFVGLLDATDNLLTPLLLGFDSVLRNEADRKGSFSQLVNLTMASADNVYLSFGLFQFTPTSSSAAGIDNLLVQSVPEPGSLALLSMGLIGLGFSRRKS